MLNIILNLGLILGFYFLLWETHFVESNLLDWSFGAFVFRFVWGIPTAWRCLFLRLLMLIMLRIEFFVFITVHTANIIINIFNILYKIIDSILYSSMSSAPFFDSSPQTPLSMVISLRSHWSKENMNFSSFLYFESNFLLMTFSRVPHLVFSVSVQTFCIFSPTFRNSNSLPRQAFS